MKTLQNLKSQQLERDDTTMLGHVMGGHNGGRSEKEIFRGVSSFSRRRCSVAFLVVHNSQQQLTITTRSDGAKFSVEHLL